MRNVIQYLPRSGLGMQPGALAPGMLIASEPLIPPAPEGAPDQCHGQHPDKPSLREPVITAPVRTDLYQYIGGIVRGEGGKPLEIGGIADHVHLVIRLKSVHSVATMVKIIKSKSSKWLNAQPKRPGRFEWQRGYAAFTVSASQLEKLRAYVRNQAQHHRRRTFQDELRALLDRHGVEYDDRYIWD